MRGVLLLLLLLSTGKPARKKTMQFSVWPVEVVTSHVQHFFKAPETGVNVKGGCFLFFFFKQNQTGKNR